MPLAGIGGHGPPYACHPSLVTCHHIHPIGALVNTAEGGRRREGRILPAWAAATARRYFTHSCGGDLRPHTAWPDLDAFHHVILDTAASAGGNCGKICAGTGAEIVYNNGYERFQMGLAYRVSDPMKLPGVLLGPEVLRAAVGSRTKARSLRCGLATAHEARCDTHRVAFACAGMPRRRPDRAGVGRAPAGYRYGFKEFGRAH